MRKVGKKMAHLPHTNGSRITLNGYAVRKECRKKARLPQMCGKPSAKRRQTFRKKAARLPQKTREGIRYNAIF